MKLERKLIIFLNLEKTITSKTITGVYSNFGKIHSVKSLFAQSQ